MKSQAILFDMDGVLVDTSDSYDSAIIETVNRFGGGAVTVDDIYGLRLRGGYNNDWVLTEKLLQDRGIRQPYEKIKAAFIAVYVGNGDGLINRERWLLAPEVMRDLKSTHALGIFTGRNRMEAGFALRAAGTENYFSAIVTEDDVARPKPDPEGLYRALELLRAPAAVYLGDSVDDCRAARAAGIPFIGVIPPRHRNKSLLRETFIKMDVPTILDDVNQIREHLHAQR